ncbi:MAG: hypothetical protein WC919_01310 [Candidatus Paceibacterota bacterium]|jgi:hypothetical protein|nr:hypothetical protein [Candidatus Paceibacterota bacterium]
MFYEKVNTFVSEDTPEEETPETPEVPAEGGEEGEEVGGEEM